MTSKSDYLENKQTDAFWRGQAFTPPATHYFGLLTTTKGPRANTTVYAANDTISLTANDGKTHLYKCTTAGTSAAAQSTLFPGTANEVITDGTAGFTEQQLALDAGTAQVEPSGSNYARVGVAASLANFAGTQGATSTSASTGISGTTSNNVVITFPAPGASAWGNVWAVQTYDAATGGNCLYVAPMPSVQYINANSSAPLINISQFTSQEDN